MRVERGAGGGPDAGQAAADPLPSRAAVACGRRAVSGADRDSSRHGPLRLATTTPGTAEHNVREAIPI